MFRSILVLLALLSVWPPNPLPEGRQAPCRFSVQEPAEEPTILGPAEVTSRILVPAQRRSPLQIVRADFTGADALVTPDSWAFRRLVAIVDVRNTSDQLVDLFRLWVQYGPPDHASPYPELKLEEAYSVSWAQRLEPGGTTSVVLRPGPDPRFPNLGRHAAAQVLISKVRVGGCVFTDVEDRLPLSPARR